MVGERVKEVLGRNDNPGNESGVGSRLKKALKRNNPNNPGNEMLSLFSGRIDKKRGLIRTSGDVEINVIFPLRSVLKRFGFEV